MKKGVLKLKATGVVRRLDDLGRLVIPKEIRKRFQMKEGDSIEFFMIDDQIMIKKYEPLSLFVKEIRYMCEILSSQSQNTVFFVQEDYLNHYDKTIRPEFINKCRNTHSIMNFENYPVWADMTNGSNGVICPVSSYGEWLGAFVMIFDQTKENEMQLELMKAFREILLKKQNGD